MSDQERSPYTIRTPTLNDVEPIRRMQAQSWRDTYDSIEHGVTAERLTAKTEGWFEPEALKKSHEHLGAVFANPEQFYRVALVGHKVVGLLHLDTSDDGSAHLWGLYTAKETHGTGLAQDFMKLALVWIDGRETSLEVAEYNERAKAFYRKYDFVEQSGIVEMFSGKIPCVKMVRKAPESMKSKEVSDE